MWQSARSRTGLRGLRNFGVCFWKPRDANAKLTFGRLDRCWSHLLADRRGGSSLGAGGVIVVAYVFVRNARLGLEDLAAGHVDGASASMARAIEAVGEAGSDAPGWR